MPRVTSGQAARRAGSRLFPDVPEHTATAVQRAARGARVWLSQKPPRLSLARVLAPPPPPPTRARMRRTRPAAADTMVVDTNTRRAGSRARPQECRSERARRPTERSWEEPRAVASASREAARKECVDGYRPHACWNSFGPHSGVVENPSSTTYL